MKASIHPKWYKDAQVTCACGNVFTLGATQQTIQVEVCSVCHPFYTGQMKFVDTAGRVDAFKSKLQGAAGTVVKKSEKRKMKRAKRIQAELDKPETLAEVRKIVGKTSKKKQKSSKKN